MCGIIGYLGERSAAPIIMESLKRLEYRGYDSAGVAIFNEADGQTSVVKSAAKVDTLVDRLTEEMPQGRMGIGHTRWATHGRPTVINAHPHTDCHKQIMVIHNGIIENFAGLRKDLQAKGHVFISETDTEVVPHLIEEFDKGDLVAAVRQALSKLRGAYAMAIFSQRDPDLLIGARLNAPLVVGIGDKEWFVASDITAVIPYTNKDLARIPVEVEPASEFRYRQPIIDQETLVIGVSQSGETADTLAAIREARERKAKVVSITNVVGSSMALESDGVIYLHAGPEIGVASTKTFIAHLTCLYLLGIRLAAIRHRLAPERLRELTAELKTLPEAVQSVLDRAEQIQALAKKYSGHRNFMYIGRGINYPIALEGALKLKEISYLHAEGYAAGELKHGPIALLDGGFPVFAVATQAATLEKMVSNIQEVIARDAPVIALVTAGDHTLDEIEADRFEVPEVSEFVSPIVNVVALQLFAYFVATERGCNVDQPRNLAKSVTVE